MALNFSWTDNWNKWSSMSESVWWWGSCFSPGQWNICYVDMERGETLSGNDFHYVRQILQMNLSRRAEQSVCVSSMWIVTHKQEISTCQFLQPPDLYKTSASPRLLLRGQRSLYCFCRLLCHGRLRVVCLLQRADFAQHRPLTGSLCKCRFLLPDWL